MKHSDAQIITDEKIAWGWNQTVEKYEMRLQHQADGKSIAVVAEYKGNVAGYIPDGSGVWYRNEICPQN